MKVIVGLILALCTCVSYVSAAITWDAPETISASGVNSSDPQVVIDTNGNATAVWVEDGLIKASTHPSGGSWDAAVTLSGANASSPRLGIDSSGNVTAIWLQNTNVKAASKPFGGSWSLETIVSGVGATAPRLAVDETGNAVVVWVRTGTIEASTRLLAGLWGLPAMLSGANSDNPDVSIGANGTTIAVWHTVIAGADMLQSSKAIIGGVWGTPVNFFPASASLKHNFPRVAVDYTGSATAIWFRYTLNGEFNNVEVLSAILPAGATAWSLPPAIISGIGRRNPANLSAQISFDADGDAMALWSFSNTGALFNIEGNAKLVGGNWIDPNPVTAGDRYAFQGDLAATSIGSGVAAYMHFDGTSPVINAAEMQFNAGNGWSGEATLSAGNDAYPQVAAVFRAASTAMPSNVINSVAVWVHSDGTNTRIQAATGARTLINPPTNLAVVQNVNSFGVLDEYYNTLSWTASSSPFIANYVIRRNGFIIETVPSTTLSYVDQNRGQNEAVTYGISAIDINGEYSPIAEVSFP